MIVSAGGLTMDGGDGPRARVDRMLRDMFRALQLRPTPPRLLSTLEPEHDETKSAAGRAPRPKGRRAARG